MLLTRSIRRSSLSRILSYDLASKIINRCLTQTINVKYPKSIGYLVLHSKKYINKNNEVKTLNYKLIAYFSSNNSTRFSIAE